MNYDVNDLFRLKGDVWRVISSDKYNHYESGYSWDFLLVESVFGRINVTCFDRDEMVNAVRLRLEEVAA